MTVNSGAAVQPGLFQAELLGQRHYHTLRNAIVESIGICDTKVSIAPRLHNDLAR